MGPYAGGGQRPPVDERHHCWPRHAQEISGLTGRQHSRERSDIHRQTCTDGIEQSEYAGGKIVVDLECSIASLESEPVTGGECLASGRGEDDGINGRRSGANGCCHDWQSTE